MSTKYSEFRYIRKQPTLFEGVESRAEFNQRAKAETEWLLEQPSANRYAFIGCSAKKIAGHLGTWPSELYTSQLFKARLEYVRSRGLPWYVMSAKYGLVGNEEMVRPYDMTLNQWSKPDLAAWHLSIAFRLLNDLCDDDDPRDITIELHAGKAYCEPVATHLRAVGFKVERPLQGLGIGEQLAWYKRQSSQVLGV